VTDSLKKKYFYRLGINILSIPISLITHSIIPRALGPIAYGSYHFITNIFTEITGFFDSGTSNALYTKLSKRPHETKIVRFYWSFTSIILLTILFFVLSSFIFNYHSIIWLDQEEKYIMLGLCTSFIFMVSKVVIKIIDAYGLTVKGELNRITQKIIGLGVITTLFFINKLNLFNFFLFQSGITITLIIMWSQVLRANGIKLFPNNKLSYVEIKNYSYEFYQYCFPLIIYGFISLLTAFMDRWLLQRISGSIEQGFYSFSYQIGALCFMFSYSMTSLFTREISVAHGKKDWHKIKNMIKMYLPMFYSISAVFCIFCIFQAESIVFIMGGEKYKSAVIPVSIMLCYPIHQTWGQLCGSVFYSIDRTKLYRNIGITSMLIGIIATYIFMAPREYYGLQLGSTGLALKMIITQLILTNIQLWYITKIANISYIRLFTHQFLSILCIGIISYLSKSISDMFFNNIIFSLIFSGVIYLFLIALLAYTYPSIFATDREKIKFYLKFLKLNR